MRKSHSEKDPNSSPKEKYSQKRLIIEFLKKFWRVNKSSIIQVLLVIISALVFRKIVGRHKTK